MKRCLASVYLLCSLAVGLSCFAAYAQEKTVKKVPVKPTAATSGKDLFHQYCAVCHGQDAKGAGPAADALKKSPTDLTQLSRKNNGKFPEQRVLATFKGEDNVTAHGSQDMPVWGTIFTNMSPNLTQGQDRIYSLLHYVEEIQAK
jgi:mono/diheme cytochrome c family protein